jgi:small conductance mechanosensitive channel
MTHELWVRLGIALAAIVASFVIAKLVDRRLARRHLQPGTITRYRILRQSILWSIVFIGVVSSLLVIPQVRGVAAGILASSAVIGLVLGFAAQRTIGNFIAGLLIAFTQPIRLGDEIEFDGTRGVVEEVGLIYTWVRTPDSDRLVIPNEMLVSKTVRNSTIRNDRRLAEISVHVPLGVDLRTVVSALDQHSDEVVVTRLGEAAATVAVRRFVEAGMPIGLAQSDLRLDVADELREAWISGTGE